MTDPDNALTLSQPELSSNCTLDCSSQNMGRRQTETLDVFRPLLKVKARSAFGEQLAESLILIQQPEVTESEQSLTSTVVLEALNFYSPRTWIT